MAPRESSIRTQQTDTSILPLSVGDPNNNDMLRIEVRVPVITPSALNYLGPLTAISASAGSVAELAFVIQTKNNIPVLDGKYGIISIHLPQVFSMKTTTRLRAYVCPAVSMDQDCDSGLVNPNNISLDLNSQSKCFEVGSTPCTLEVALCQVPPYAETCASSSNFVRILLNQMIPSNALLKFTLTDIPQTSCQRVKRVTSSRIL